VFSRGLLKPAQTRMYFPDEEANARDPVLRLVPAEDRHTLIATTDGDGLRFDIHLQGERETVFFDVDAG
jgi:protocatechuate 3,4-dioxygenase alpha subunit